MVANLNVHTISTGVGGRINLGGALGLGGGANVRGTPVLKTSLNGKPVAIIH